MASEFDVIVVGTGPAGAISARNCAKHGLKTLLLEKEQLPRYKSCGGGVTERALSLLDFAIPASLIEGECRVIQLRYGRCRATLAKQRRLFVFVSRAQFDAFLTQKAIEAGATLQDGTSVRAVEINDRCAIVRCKSGTYHSKLVIGADGAYSVVARNVRPVFRRDQIGVACDVHLDPNEMQLGDDPPAVFQFGEVPHGYAWIFPSRDRLAVGIGGAANRLRSPKDTLREVLALWGVTRDIPNAHWHLVPSGGVRRESCADRIVLVGDAAGYVDPMVGAGIELAIRSGTYAAETAILAAHKGDWSRQTLLSYHVLCDSSFGGELRTRLVLHRLMHRFPNALIRPFAMSPRLLQFLLGS